MTNKKLYALLLLSVILISCGKESGRAIEKRFDGINGPSIYYFDNRNNLFNVQKEEYYSNPNYNVMIRKDTIRLGEEFLGLVFTKANYKVTVVEPERMIFEGDSNHLLRDFRYTPKGVGQFNFKGTIEHDTTVVPFEYKFIVLPKE